MKFKVPTNDIVIGTLKKYGFGLLIFIAIFFVSLSLVRSSIKFFTNLSLPICSVQEIKRGVVVEYGNKNFRVESFNYHEYTTLGNNIRINLEEEK